MIPKKLSPTYIISKYFVEKDNLTIDQIKKLKDQNVKKTMEKILENESR
jgi:hypothetical protein